MKNVNIALTLALLPIFMHADGELAMHNTSGMTKAEQFVTPFIEYHNRIAVFEPFHQVYERIKPNALYAGVEAWLGIGGNGTILTEAEFRMGYNFFYQGRHHLTPFAGVGVIKDIHSERHYYNTVWGQIHHRSTRLPAVAYGVLGILYDYEFNSVVNLGVNLKGMIGGGVSAHHINWGTPVVGFDVSVPLTFRFGHKRHWDYRIEPFDIFLHGKNMARNYYGFRNTIGYRF